MNDLLYGALDIPEIDRKKALSEIKNLTLFKYWFWDSYRATTMLPVMTLHGQPENVSHYTEGISTGDFAWTSYAPPTLREYCEKYILPITGNTRIMVLATKPGQENKEHIDFVLISQLITLSDRKEQLISNAVNIVNEV